MADQPPIHGSAGDGTRARPLAPSVPDSSTPEATSRTPRWVKLFGIIGVVLVVLIIVMLLTGHGPGRHMHSGLRDHGPSAGLALGRITAIDEHRA